MYESICLFTKTGSTYTFRDVHIILDNETVLVFTYNAMSDSKQKKMTVFKTQIIGYSLCEIEAPPIFYPSGSGVPS